MCAIVGIASRAPVQRHEWLSVASEAMAHRGPDDDGLWWSADGKTGFAHRRLAIIDLSPAGRQPMHDPSGQLTIVFNGEIYNYLELKLELAKRGHLFRSNSDTEVILLAYREWGANCVARLNGMFAFVIHDQQQQRIFMARDRAGEKPLFYAISDGELRFASELKGILADPFFPRSINADALDCYLALGYAAGTRCILNGVNKLAPAHTLSYETRTGDVRVRRYWQLPAPAPLRGVDAARNVSLVDQMDRLLEDSVRRQLVADVPVGVLLSGGVDSSLITAMASRVSKDVQTFTLGFPGHANHDETSHARLVARHFGTRHTEIQASDIRPDILPTLARQFDEPMLDSSMLPTFLISQLVRKHCRVALGGDGGDELFGGYFTYNRLLWAQRNLDWLPIALRRTLAARGSALIPSGIRGRAWLQALGCDLNHGVPILNEHFDIETRRELLQRGMHTFTPVSADTICAANVDSSVDLLQRATRLDFQTGLADGILVKVDRTSMLNSLEIRAPLLDCQIIEFAFRDVPSSMKATASERKIILKRLAQRLLPANFDRKRKHGFTVPLEHWLKSGPWMDLFNAVLLDRDCLFERKTVNRLLDEQRRGWRNGERLFGLVLFELWRREYRVS